MALPTRWFPIPQKAQQHPTISRYTNSINKPTVPNICVCAGRRSFKTEKAKRAIVHAATTQKGWTIVVGAPTFAQLVKIFWKDLKDLIDPRLIKKVSEAMKTIDMWNGSQIMLVSMKEAQRMEGIPVHMVVIDEAQQIPDLEHIVSSTISPGLVATDGFLLLIGRPNNLGYYYKCFKKGLDPNNEEWVSFTWKSSEVMTKKQIERAKSEVSALHYEREYDAIFSNSLSMCYNYMEQMTKLPVEVLQMPIDPLEPLVLFTDFNYSVCPFSTGIGQFRRVSINGMLMEIFYIHEVQSNQYTNTEMQIELLKESIDTYLPNLTWKDYIYNVYGDFAGHQNKSSSSVTDWEIFARDFKDAIGYFEYTQKCLSIRDSVGATNNRMVMANGTIYTYINKSMSQALIDDWEMLVWNDDSNDYAKTDPQYGHISRAYDYLNDYEFPVEERVTVIG